MNIGRRRRARSAAAAACLVMSGTGLAVQLITMSASAQFLVERAQVDGIAFDFRRQGLRPRERAIGDDHALDARRRRNAGR